MELWVQNSSGQKSASLTFALVGFVVVTFWLLLSIFSHVGHFDIRAFDSATAMGYLVPFLSLYFGRRWTDARATNLDTDSTSVVNTRANQGAVEVPVAPTL